MGDEVFYFFLGGSLSNKRIYSMGFRVISYRVFKLSSNKHLLVIQITPWPRSREFFFFGVVFFSRFFMHPVSPIERGGTLGFDMTFFGRILHGCCCR